VRAVRRAPVATKGVTLVAREVGTRTATVGLVKSVTVRGPAVVGLVRQPPGTRTTPPGNQQPPGQQPPPERAAPPQVPPSGPPPADPPTLPTPPEVQAVVGDIMGHAPAPPAPSELVGLQVTVGDTGVTIPLP
jgi:hypothetical protein